MNRQIFLLLSLILQTACTAEKPMAITGGGGNAIKLVAKKNNAVPAAFFTTSVSAPRSTPLFSRSSYKKTKTELVTKINPSVMPEKVSSTEYTDAEKIDLLFNHKPSNSVSKKTTTVATQKISVSKVKIEEHSKTLSLKNEKSIPEKTVAKNSITRTTQSQIAAVKKNIPLPKETADKKESGYLQLGVFSSKENAQSLQKKMVAHKMPSPMVKEMKVAGKIAYRVQLGPWDSPAKAAHLNEKLAKIGVADIWYLSGNKLMRL